MILEASDFNLIDETLCLNFVNSKNWSDLEPTFDFFGDYPSLLPWSLQMSLITPPQAEHKLALALAQLPQTQAMLMHVHQLRGAIYHIFFAIANQQEVPAADLAYFNQAWGLALMHLRVIPTAQSFRWDWVETDDALDSFLWPVLQSVAELLIAERLGRVKSCSGCNWLFLDTTKAGRRRWCDMRICGNRAKARRHYARGKAGVV